MKQTITAMMAALGLAGAAWAQTPAGTTIAHVTVEQQAQAGQQTRKVIKLTTDTAVSTGVPVAVQGRITKGAPYTADTITESVQVLADGNRIVRRTTTRVSRDSEGRTRTENTGDLGTPSVMISDPVSGESWTLNPETRTAYRGDVLVISTHVGPAGAVRVEAVRSHVEQAPPPPPPPPPALPHAGAVAGVVGGVVRIEESVKTEGEVTREDLGQRTIEGLSVTGTRTTTVIPAGAIGNELPIRVVSEQWYSPDLQLLVMSKFSDPRSGETSFRLANVSRAEPDRGLFVVPSDYTVRDTLIKREETR